MLGQVSMVAKAEVEQWKAGFEVNFFSLVSFVSLTIYKVYKESRLCLQIIMQTKAALPALRESKGKLIFTSSGVAISAMDSLSLYGATKAAMNYFTLSLANEGPDVTAIAVRPDMVDTDMQREIRQDHVNNMPNEAVSIFIEAHRDGKLCKPEQPGHVMAKLVLDAPHTLSGRFIT
jgi:NAD(P)-dependent dehydrogenase (short-subunit alcohol dehydrogenase family)